MKVTYNNVLYFVYWKHERIESETHYGESIINSAGGSTLCVIRKGKKEDGVIISESVANCSIFENYNKSVGRKVSLTRALSNCGNREFRKAVWDAYRKECHS